MIAKYEPKYVTTVVLLLYTTSGAIEYGWKFLEDQIFANSQFTNIME